MNQKNNLILANEWFRKADDDELSCEAMMQEKGAPSTLCFLSQQIVEKYLKGLLVFSGKEIGKVHDLIKLANSVKTFFPKIKDFQKEISLLNRYYIETRYPGDWPEGFSWEEGKIAFNSAKKIKKHILEYIS